MKKDFYYTASAIENSGLQREKTNNVLWYLIKFDKPTMKTSKTVLTVDDDSSIRLLIRSALQSLKTVKVIEAEDGLAGLEAVQKHQPDLVILDVMMPNLDGIGALKELRSNPVTACMPVIMLTGVKDKSKLLPLLEQNSTDYLPKPFIIEMLRQKVASMLFPSAN
ncbi:MAG: PleD family two-component system response regulator [bacterium]